MLKLNRETYVFCTDGEHLILDNIPVCQSNDVFERNGCNGSMLSLIEIVVIV